MKRAVRLLGRLALALVALACAGMVAFATISLGSQASEPAPPSLHGRAPTLLVGSGELLAGAARVELAPPARGPIAGYPAYRRDDGSGEPIFVRALVLEQGDLHAVLISLPLLMVPGPLEEELVQRAGLAPATCLLAAATHTHAGPGGTWNNLLVELGGNGLYRPARADAVVKAAADAIALARHRLAPAHVAAGIEAWPDGPAVARSGVIDPALGAARVLDADGRALASLVVYAMHATVIPRSVHGLEGDWPEAAARALEDASDGAPALIFQGAGGNATWSRAGLPDAPAEAAAQLGARVAAEAGRALSAFAPAPGTAPLACSTRIVALPAPRPGVAVARIWRTAAANLLRRYAERAAVESTVQLPGLELLGVPGEPAGELAFAVRRAHGGRAMLVGLADGYAGYVETAERWLRGDGESARTWYGADLAAALGLAPARPARSDPVQ